MDGAGQEPFSFRATGRVLYARDEDGRLTAAIDPSAAYEHIAAWTRRFELTDDALIVTDHIELDAAGEIAYLLHTLSRPEAAGERAVVERNGWRMTIAPEEGDLHDLTISDRFGVDLNEGVPEAYRVTMPPQYHLRWVTPKRRVHDIRVRYDVWRG